MVKKRGLAKGRGLGKLLSDVQEVQNDLNDKSGADNPTKQSLVKALSLVDLQRGKYQPRREIAEDALNELAESIKEHGVMQPIVVREVNTETKYEIIAGERRWRAAKLAGLDSIPAIIRDITDDVAIALALIENIQREDLSPIEQALALQRFADEFDMNHAQIAKTVGKARATVSNLLRLLGLHDEVKTMLSHGDLDMGHARAILAIPKEQQSSVAKKVIANGLTVRQTEALVKNFLNPVAKTPKEQVNQDIVKLSQSLSEKLGALVEINQKSSGKGKMTISYHNPEELDGILELLQAKTPT